VVFKEGGNAEAFALVAEGEILFSGEWIGLPIHL
jgi:hypothetical protein